MKNKENIGKRFADWVNADENLPSLAELEKSHHENSEHEPEEHVETTQTVITEITDKVEIQSVTVDIVDADLLYPDDIETGEDIKEKIRFTEMVFADLVINEELEKENINKFNFVYGFAAILLALFVVSCLLITVSQLPSVGDSKNPTINEVYSRYLGKSIEETGATNVVAGIILDYRAFDTLGESFVLFTATMGVVMLLRKAKPLTSKSKNNKEEHIPDYNSLDNSIILRTIVSMLFPFIFVFGIYVVLNGHLSPGGGFSGGAILGGGLSLYATAYGIERVRKFFTFRTFGILNGVSLLFYAVVKGILFMAGASGNHLNIPLGKPGDILSAGLILPLNICVGIIVCCTIYGLYALFNESEV